MRRKNISACTDQYNTACTLRLVCCCRSHNTVSVGLSCEMHFLLAQCIGNTPYIVSKIMKCYVLDAAFTGTNGTVIVCHDPDSACCNTPCEFIELRRGSSVACCNDKHLPAFSENECLYFYIVVTNDLRYSTIPCQKRGHRKEQCYSSDKDFFNHCIFWVYLGNIN